MTLGVIALDIDGTVTSKGEEIPRKTELFLEKVNGLGWKIVFLTGRNYSLGRLPLAKLRFPYLLGVQNGGTVISMPEEEVIWGHYLFPEALGRMLEWVRDEPTDVVVYSGFENEDRCYYRPNYFSSELLQYLERRLVVFAENWIPMDSFQDLPVDRFVSLKCFGSSLSLNRVAKQARSELGMHMPVIEDPFDRRYYVGQATHQMGSKGAAIERIRQYLGNSLPMIAAGDDFNDEGMLRAADISVVMGTAPDAIKVLGDVLAPPAEEEGIIWGLEQAIRRSTGKEV